MLYQNVIDGVIMQYHKETENSVFKRYINMFRISAQKII